MKKLLGLFVCLVVAACGSHSESPSGGGRLGGGINTGKLAGSVTLTSGNNNDVVVPGHQGASALYRLVANASGSTLTGLDDSGMDEGDLFFVQNTASSGSITLTDSDTASLLGHRFSLAGATSVVLAPGQAALVVRQGAVGAGSFLVGMGPGVGASTTFNGSTTFTGARSVGVETPTSGALSATKLSNLSVTASVAFTLPDGTVAGQVKIIECTVAASTPVGTLTITTPLGSEPGTHVFNTVGQRLELIWTGTGWHHVAKTRAGSLAVVVGTTVLTGFDMNETYALSVTGTVSSATTKGIPNGVVAGERIHLNTPTAASTPSGSITITAITIATNAAATTYGGINATSCNGDFVWDGAAWQNIALTTATLS